jgi:hypothetical protein
MPINRLYATWFPFLRQLLPAERLTRVRNLTYLLCGLSAGRSVTLSHIASYVPLSVKLLSVVRRLDRFLENPAFDVRCWYEPQVRAWLTNCPGRRVRLIIDSTPIGFGQQWLVIALAHRRRAVPLVWDWVPHRRGHSPVQQQLALWRYLHTLLPPGRTVVVVGDAEFGSVAVLRQLDAWGWYYVFRQKGRLLVHPHGAGAWQRLAQLRVRAGQTRRLAQWQLTARHAYPTHLVLHWAVGAARPWRLVTNLPTAAQALCAYRRRMWIEQLFGDVKGHGVQFDTTHLRDPAKLSRLAFVVAVWYVHCVVLGTQHVAHGRCPQVDRHDRRDLSLFQIGWRWARRRLWRGLPVPMSLSPFPP